MRTTLLAATTALALLSGCGQAGTDVALDSGSGGTSPPRPSISAATSSVTPTPPATTESTVATPPTQTTPGPAPATPPREPAHTPGEPRELGADEQAQIGVRYRYRLYTHCGIETTWWNGAWWNADPTLSDGNGNPPPGWGNPYEDGVIVQVSETRLEFTGDGGGRAVFTPRPAQDGAPPPCA